MKFTKFVSGFVLIASISACTKKIEPSKTTDTKTSSAHEDPEGFYTCPMHAQVHMHEPGNCPICGMPTVKASRDKLKKQTQENTQNQMNGQKVEMLKTQGASRITISKKDLVFNVPASGRLVSSRVVVFQVYESDLLTVKIGSLFLGSTSLGSANLKGKITQIDSLVDPTSRTVRVVGSLDESPIRFIQEGSFHAVISTTLKDQISVPEDAVLHTGLRELVYTFTSDGNLVPKDVVLGQKADKEYQVLNGLNEGEVISGGPNFLFDSEAKLRGDR